MAWKILHNFSANTPGLIKTSPCTIMLCHFCSGKETKRVAEYSSFRNYLCGSVATSLVSLVVENVLALIDEGFDNQKQKDQRNRCSSLVSMSTPGLAELTL